MTKKCHLLFEWPLIVYYGVLLNCIHLWEQFFSAQFLIFIDAVAAARLTLIDIKMFLKTLQNMTETGKETA